MSDKLVEIVFFPAFSHLFSTVTVTEEISLCRSYVNAHESTGTTVLGLSSDCALRALDQICLYIPDNKTKKLGRVAGGPAPAGAYLVLLRNQVPVLGLGWTALVG